MRLITSGPPVASRTIASVFMASTVPQFAAPPLHRAEGGLGGIEQDLADEGLVRWKAPRSEAARWFPPVSILAARRTRTKNGP